MGCLMLMTTREKGKKAVEEINVSRSYSISGKKNLHDLENIKRLNMTTVQID